MPLSDVFSFAFEHEEISAVHLNYAFVALKCYSFDCHKQQERVESMC